MKAAATRYLSARSCRSLLVRPSAIGARHSSTLDDRQWSTPLAKTIAEAIETTGPISIAAYMRQCLTNPEAGYYTTKSKDRDQFGERGDFITSPEISQIFGELVGLWIVAEWISQGKKSTGVELVEFGPGRGTLMDDILRTIRNFKPLASSIESVYLIEASRSLREKQKALLCGDAPMDEVRVGFQSRSKYAGIPITWCEDIKFIPNEASKSPFFVAHEFFDALPIHAFQSVDLVSSEQPSPVVGLDGKPILVKGLSSSSGTNQWREMLVSVAPPAPFATTDHRPLLSAAKPEFQLSLAKASTPTSLVLPKSSPRYTELKARADSVIEVSPEARSYVAEIARRIGGRPSNSVSKRTPSGAALIIDYGPQSTVPTSTLRGIRAHNLVSPFTAPGQVDLSADVDFFGLAEAAIEASEGVEVHGPIEQGEWLERMGVRERAEMLAKAAAEDASKAEGIQKAVRRLVERSGGGMGRLYKAMAIVPEAQGKRRPVGFGGELF